MPTASNKAATNGVHGTTVTVVSQWKDLTLSTGEVIQIRQMNPLLMQKVSAAHKLPPRPTYEAVTVSGAVEHHPMDAESAAQTPGGLAVWQEYLDEMQRVQNEQNTAVTNALLVIGTRYLDMPDDWEALHTLLGIEIPTNPDARRGHYLSTVIPPDDTKLIITEIMKISGVSEEQVREAEDSFRDPLSS